MIDLSLLAPEWQILEHFIGVGVNPNPIIPANPRRFTLIFTYVNPAPNPPNVAPNSFVCRLFTSNSTAIGNIGGVLIQQWTPITFDFPKYAGLVQRAWNADDGGAGGNLVVTEVIQTAGTPPKA